MLTPKRKGTEYHHGDLKHAAIVAARKIVETYGITGLGLRKVAYLAGVSPAALYRHFENLEDLLISLSEQIREELGRKMSSALADTQNKDSGAVIDRLKVLGEAYIEFAEENPKLFGAAFLNRDDSTIDDYTELPWLLLRDAVSNLLENNHSSESKASELQIALWSLVHGCASLVASQALSPREIETFKKSVALGIEKLCRA